MATHAKSALSKKAVTHVVVGRSLYDTIAKNEQKNFFFSFFITTTVRNLVRFYIHHMSLKTGLQRIILITGANKGIGFEIVKKLVQQPLSNTNNVILLGSRDLKRGQEALRQLGSPLNVHLLQVDTSSKESITHAFNEINQKYSGQLDVIINNAGISPKDDSAQAARETLATNYYGIKILNEQLIPLLRNNGRVVNVASALGPMILMCMSKYLQDKYTPSTLTVEQLDRLVEDFVSALEFNNLEKVGYPSELHYLAYGVSKAALIALTRLEARQHSGGKKICIYSVCPGYCSTDINKHGPGARSPKHGADSILHVMNTSNNELENGALYFDGKKIPEICVDSQNSRIY
jgi:carbonyl reductase 1